jgi:hypothetical protein
MALLTQLGKNNAHTTKEVFNVHDVLIQLCEESHASCTLKTSFVVPTLFLTLFTQLGKNNVGTTKEVFNVHDA